MIPSDDIRIAADLLLIELEDDYSPLSDAWWMIRSVTGAEDECLLKGASLSMLENLLGSGRIVVGDLDDDYVLVPWTGNAVEVLERLRHEWNGLDSVLPGAGQICWIDRLDS